MSKVLLSILVMLLVAIPALAIEKRYTHFSVDVPNGWQIQEHETSCGFILPEKKLLMLVSASEDSISEEEFLDAFATEWKVKNFETVGTNWFSFTSEKYANRGMHVRGFIGKSDGVCKFIVLSGDDAELDALYATVKFF